MELYSVSGISNSSKSPYGLYCLTFILLQVLQLLTTSFTNFFIPRKTYFYYIYKSVLTRPIYPPIRTS